MAPIDEIELYCSEGKGLIIPGVPNYVKDPKKWLAASRVAQGQAHKLGGDKKELTMQIYRKLGGEFKKDIREEYKMGNEYKDEAKVEGEPQTVTPENVGPTEPAEVPEPVKEADTKPSEEVTPEVKPEAEENRAPTQEEKPEEVSVPQKPVQNEAEAKPAEPTKPFRPIDQIAL